MSYESASPASTAIQGMATQEETNDLVGAKPVLNWHALHVSVRPKHADARMTRRLYTQLPRSLYRI